MHESTIDYDGISKFLVDTNVSKIKSVNQSINFN